MMLWLAWSYGGRRRVLGRVGAVSCLFGAGFSLARGAWIAILIGIVYLIIDGALSRRRKLQLVAWFLSAAVVLAGVYLINYGVDPVSGRAGGGASVRTRQSLYGDTVGGLKDYHVVTGYGTERPRITDDTPRGAGGGDYVPRAGTHSTYLNYLFRTGLVGLVGILVVYLIAALSARAGSRTHRGSEQLFSTMVTAVVVSAMAHGAILSLYVEPTYTLTVSLFLGLATVSSGGPINSFVPWRRKRNSQRSP
jgi:O-antigen ligase